MNIVKKMSLLMMLQEILYSNSTGVEDKRNELGVQ